MFFNFKNLSLTVICALMSTMMMAQVSGVVTDAGNGEPLIGASVFIKGSTVGTITDIDGSYSIDASATDILVVSFVGYTEIEELVGSRSTVNVGLSVGELLSEVVVTGYSSQRKRDITGAVAVVDSDDLNEINASSFTQKLQGKVSGVQVSTSGEPGAGSSIRIRGVSSFQNNDPLYVIDGVPSTDNFNTGLNPNDIESIQVLKDASAASIYGARANNGVVIVTTKKGKPGKTIVTYNANYGIQNPVGRYNLINDPVQYSEVVHTAFENAGIDIPVEVPYSAGRGVIPEYIYAGDFSGFPGSNPVNEDNYSFPNNLIMRSGATNWWDEVFRSAPTTEHTLGISGGNESARFNISAGYLNQQGTLIETFFRRVSIRANSEFKRGRFTFGENLSLARSNGLGQNGGNQSEQNTLSQILKAQAIVPVFDISGVNYGGGKANGLSNGGNPVAAQIRQRDNIGTFYKILGNAYAEFEVIDGLNFRTSFGIDFFNNFTQGFSFPTWEESEPTTINGFQERNQGGFNWTWTNTLTYDFNLGDQHGLKAFVGYESIKNQGRTIGGSLANYFTDDINAWYLNTGLADPGSRNVFSFGGFSTLASIFGKVDYSYNDRYLLSLTVRRDGSSNFGPSNRYGVFPAASFGWRLSEEAFLKDVDVIDDLKLRVGYGITGNQNIPGGNTVDRFGGGPGNSFYDITGANSSIQTGFALTGRGNPDSKWEENKSLNVGFDLGLSGGKFNIVFDWYDRTTDGLLFNPELPGPAGTASSPFVNIAKMQNTGVDLSINYRDQISQDASFNIGLNVGHYQNTILEIDGERESFFPAGQGRIGRINYNPIGGSIGSFFGWQTDGIFRSQAEVDAHAAQDGKAIGRLRLKDLNGDGVVNDGDLGTIGSYHPDLTIGLNLGVEFGNFDISTFFTGTIGNDIYNYNKLFEVFRFFNSNVSDQLLDRAFHPTDNPDGDWPIIDEGDTFSERSTDFYVENGSYIRMRTLQLGYTIPASSLGSSGIGSLRVYVQGQNLLTFTGYEGIDPELSSFGVNGNSDQNAGFDFGNYPSSKVIMFGVNASF